jgi:hypothetical protein
MQTLVLDKVRWARGGRLDSNGDQKTNSLLGSDGCMCCLGFHLGVCGLPASEMLSEGDPEEVAANLADKHQALHVDGKGIAPIPDYLVTWLADESARWKDSRLCEEMMAINDDPAIESDFWRVVKLNVCLQKHNAPIVVQLVDTPEECEAAGGLRANFAESAA